MRHSAAATGILPGAERSDHAADTGFGCRAQRSYGRAGGVVFSSVGQAQPHQDSAGTATGDNPTPPPTQTHRRLRPRQNPDYHR